MICHDNFRIVFYPLFQLEIKFLTTENGDVEMASSDDVPHAATIRTVEEHGKIVQDMSIERTNKFMFHIKE